MDSDLGAALADMDSELGAALAEMIDAFVDSREEWLRIHGSMEGFNSWCAEKVHGVKQ